MVLECLLTFPMVWVCMTCKKKEASTRSSSLIPLTYTKRHEKRHVPYSHTAPILKPLIPYRSSMLGLVRAFPHATPYCFRLFHTTTRSKFRWFFLLFLSTIDLGGNINQTLSILNRKERFLSGFLYSPRRRASSRQRPPPNRQCRQSKELENLYLSTD